MKGAPVSWPRSCRLVGLLVLIALCGGPSLTAAADDASVPTFLGNPEHTGEMPGPGPGETPEVVWQFETGGKVVASPAVVNGVVYITSGTGDGNLYAVDAATGDERWRFQINLIDHPLAASSSPTVEDGVVYVGSNDGFLYALDVDSGAALWRWQAGGDPGGTRVESSPVAADGVVYFSATDVFFRFTLYAIEIDSRTALWEQEIPVTFQTAPTVADGLILGLGLGQAGAWALDAATGAERWTVDAGNSAPAAPAVSGGVAYFAADDGELFALDVATGRLVWQAETGADDLSSPAVAGGFVYINTEQQMIALDAATGELQWRADLVGTVSGQTNLFVSSPAVADGVVYAGTDAGIVFAIDAATGAERWRLDLGSSITSSPAVIDGMVYIGDASGALSAIGNP